MFALKSLTQSPGDDVDLVHDIVSLADASSMGPVQAHSVNLVHKRQRSVAMSHVAQLLQRTYGTCRSPENEVLYLEVA